MSYWVKQTQDAGMPVWLKKSLNPMCGCGTEKENYYNDNGECTNRRCPNPKCKYTLAQRIADMCTILEIPGVKEGRGLQLVEEYRLENHYQALQYILGSKPKITLACFMRISFIPSVDKTWNSLCEGASSLDELLERLPYKYKELVEPCKDLLYEGIRYVDLYIPEVSNVKVLVRENVMISGNIKGHAVRENFIAAINSECGGLVDIRVVGKRKTDVFCLIQEADEPRRQKAECALSAGIPIYTPTEFVTVLAEKLKNAISREGSRFE